MKKLDKKTRRRIIRDTRLLLICGIVAAVIYFAGPFSGEERTSSDSAQKTEETSQEVEGEDISEAVSASETQDEEKSSEEIQEENSLTELGNTLEGLISQQNGQWSIYVKDLEEDVSITIQNSPIYSASLIKLFVMEKSFLDFDEVATNESALSSGEDPEGQVMSLLTDMIERSDNESFNELVRLQSEEGDFAEGCVDIDIYLGENGYEDTVIYHSLSPSVTGLVSIADEENCTSVEDCGNLLEKIYNGTCVSEEASAQMLELLLNQETVNKIPEGVPNGVEVANKTGETDEVQHDAAIVYGPSKDYILCVMSEDKSGAGSSIELIQEISRVTYEYLNPKEESDSGRNT